MKLINFNKIKSDLESRNLSEVQPEWLGWL